MFGSILAVSTHSFCPGQQPAPANASGSNNEFIHIDAILSTPMLAPSTHNISIELQVQLQIQKDTALIAGMPAKRKNDTAEAQDIKQPKVTGIAVMQDMLDELHSIANAMCSNATSAV